MDSPAILGIVQQDISDAQTLNVRKTPGFFVNGKPLVTFGSEQLKTLILSELDRNYPN
jgi:protein-disulfide isomerase